MSGGGGGGKYATCAPGFDRYTSIVDRYTPGMVRYGSRADRVTPPEMEIANSCRSFLLSRLKAAEVLSRQLSEDASTINRLRSVQPPVEYHVDIAFEKVHAQLLDLIEADIKVIRQLLYVGEQLEEMKWQRNYGGGGEGSPWSPSMDMSLADIESVDLDPYMDYLASNKRLRDDVINGDDADDVFQNDDTGRGLAKPSCPIQSNELHLTLTRSGNGVKVNSSNDTSSSSKAQLNYSNSRTVSKLTKVEFQVSGTQERGNTPRPAVAPKPHDDLTAAKDNHGAAKVELKPAATKDGEPTTVASPSLGFRLVLQQHEELTKHSHEPQNGQEAVNRGVNASQGNQKRMNQTTKVQSSHLRLGNSGQGHRQVQTEEDTKQNEISGNTLSKKRSTINVITHL